MGCHFLLPWTTFCHNFPLWFIHHGWPCTLWLILHWVMQALLPRQDCIHEGDGLPRTPSTQQFWAEKAFSDRHNIYSYKTLVQHWHNLTPAQVSHQSLDFCIFKNMPTSEPHQWISVSRSRSYIKESWKLLLYTCFPPFPTLPPPFLCKRPWVSRGVKPRDSGTSFVNFLASPGNCWPDFSL